MNKRTYCSYYLSLIKMKHLLFFSFYNNKNDYNSQIVKINLIFIGFIIDFFINSLFLMMIQCIKYMKKKAILISCINYHKLFIQY